MAKTKTKKTSKSLRVAKYEGSPADTKQRIKDLEQDLKNPNLDKGTRDAMKIRLTKLKIKGV